MIVGAEPANHSLVARSYLGVGLLGDVNVLGSVRLAPPLVVPHLRHQLQVSLWFILFFIYTKTQALVLPEETKLLYLYSPK